jgi:diacylglycerol kinase family enzyme
MSRVAVVVNPTKLDDDEAFRKSVRRVMDDHGWDEPLWLETTPEDPGRGQAESAVSAGIGLVLACGGDGTVTACAEGITGTGVPLAIIPMGTGNLLARNIGLPMGLEEALAIALGGVQQPIDAGRVNGALIVGNVGWLRGGLPLLPDARPDDGMLDAVVLTAAGLTGWLAVAAGVLLRRPAHGRIYRVQFTELQVTLDQDQPWSWTARL